MDSITGMQRLCSMAVGLALSWLAWPGPGLAWDYAGHRIVNQLALASLPTNFPGFVQTAAARERIAFLGGEADRWRNAPDLTFRHCNGPDHFLDLDDLPLYELEPAQLSPFRYEFVAQLVRGRAAHPDRFPPIDPLRNLDHTRTLVGFLPWTISEHYSKLKSVFSYHKTFAEAGGTAEEIQNARENLIYLMGVMGHFVGDAAQPLHTTKHYNGWVGPNPNGYTTNRTFHGWIDGGYLQKAGLTTDGLLKRIRPASLLPDPESKGIHTNVFPVVMSYLREQAKLAEPLYRIEKAGKLSSEADVSEEGREFIASQLVKAAQMLGDLWVTARLNAAPDRFLTEELARRKFTQDQNPPAPGK